ncbi:Tudor domain-containing protein 7, partial [Modicella reniformis]
MTSTKRNKNRAMPAHPPCLGRSLKNEDWPAETQKVTSEQILAFFREYAKKITTALAQYTTRGKTLSEEFLRQGSEHILSPPEDLLELYTSLLRENLDLNPKVKDALTDQAFAASTLIHGDNLEQHFRRQQHTTAQQRATCGCVVDHCDEALAFPEDSYEDEPDEEGDEDEEEDEDGEEDEDDDEEEEDSMDDEEYDDEDEPDVVNGYAHHYEESNVKMMAYEDEKLKLENVRRVREEERRIKEELRKKKISERQKQKEEKERILLLKRLRLEDEERRKREALEKQRRERLEEETRKKREAAEADQNARSFLFQCTMRSQIEIVKQIIGATPKDSCSLKGVPRFATAAAIRLMGWEYVTMVEGVGEVSEEKGTQETLLHVAVRVGCMDLVAFFIDKGAPLDALDKDGLSPLHTAAKHVSPFDIGKLLVEKTAYHIDRTCIIGKTALHYAAQNGYGDLVALLLQHHARINPLDHKGNTPEALAKIGLDSALSEKSTKSNTKQASSAKVQKYRNTLQHIQKSLMALKEAQHRKDVQLEEQRRKDEALAREEAEKDNAARKKLEDKLEADLRRRLEEEKELERLKAMTDPNGNNNNSNKKKKKKKGKTGNDLPSSATKDVPAPGSPTSKADHFLGIAASLSSTIPSGHIKSDVATLHVQSAVESETTAKASTAATITTATTTVTTTAATPTAVPVANGTKSAPARIPKPKTSYRPSQLVVSRMTDMGFPLRESRKALIQTEGRVEDAIDLLTSGAQLADDSEDEVEQAAERARAKARANAAKPAPAKAQETYANGHHNTAVRPSHQPSSSLTHNH